jgi:hypothetical protein
VQLTRWVGVCNFGLMASLNPRHGVIPKSPRSYQRGERDLACGTYPWPRILLHPDPGKLEIAPCIDPEGSN